ncbi:MAG: LamG domain-containing protein, partial [Candidatus Heimdallarchaeota archaeon]
MKKKNLVLGILLIMLLVISVSLLAQNNALHFDGSDDYVISSQYINLSFQSFAIEGWFKADVQPVAGNYPHIFGVAAIGLDAAFVRINGDNSKLDFVINSSGSWRIVTSSETIQAGIWYHAAMLYQNGGTGGTDNQYLLINGEVVAWAAYEHVNNYSNNLFCIGGDGDRNFDGQVDDVKVWANVNRSSQDVRTSMYKEVVGNESNLVAYYNLDETSGTTADNGQGNTSYDGTLTNMTGNEWTTSPAFFGPKNCLDFDGNDDNVWCPTITPTVTGGSIEFWVNLDVIPTDNARLISRHSSYGYDEIYLLNNNGRIATTGSFVVGDDLQSTDPLPTDVWTHVAITANSAGSKLYINGILDDEGGAADFDYNTFRFGGQWNGASYESIDGMMDEVRLWNDVRSEAEIRENMFKTLVGDESNLVAYYNLDNEYGAVAQSYPVEANDGQVGGGPAWVISTAFNTWLDTDDTDWETAANWSDGVPSSTDNVGIYNYASGTSPTLSGTPIVNDLIVGSAVDLTLSSNVTVNGNLFLYNGLDLNGKIITLGPTTTLFEDSGNIFGTSGIITTTRIFGTGDLSSGEDIAGLGAEITTSANMGSTTIIRGHQAQDGNAINRYYQINPTTTSGLDATLVFNYLDTELNGVTEADIKLFKSPVGNVWTVQPASIVDTGNNTLSLSGIDSFSWWTAGDGDAPLPVNLSSFYALYTG